jgi:ribosomal-protein-alanine N-acetyltransferase
MSVADLDRVLEIAAQLSEAPHWPRTAYEQALNPEHAPKRAALAAEDGNSGIVIGFAVASLLAPEAELETIAVAQESQRRGMAGRLLRALFEELREARVSDLNLEVRASNAAAIGFYRAQGFAETGRRPRYYADPEEDAILLRLGIGASSSGSGANGTKSGN